MNRRLVKTDFGFEIQLRNVDNDPKSTFKQYGAGVGVEIAEYLGRALTDVESASLASKGYVELAT